MSIGGKSCSLCGWHDTGARRNSAPVSRRQYKELSWRRQPLKHFDHDTFRPPCLALSPEEERAIELKRDFAGGQERVIWNPTLSLAAKEFEFTDADVARICAALETWASYRVNIDRKWLEPLLDSIVAPEPTSQKQGFRLP